MAAFATFSGFVYYWFEQVRLLSMTVACVIIKCYSACTISWVAQSILHIRMAFTEKVLLVSCVIIVPLCIYSMFVYNVTNI